ncbi:MAG: hypothetical protein K6G20_04470 [Ruminococcus sp.]|nr:hypothetical protein [Ruminococcus sp.]
MKLNYRDKVILAIVLALAIMVAGFLSLIKPKRAAIKDNEEKLSELEDKETEINQKIGLTDGLIKKIDTSYANADKESKLFVEKSLVDTPVLLDKFMGDYANKNKVQVIDLKVDDTATATLNYYFKPYSEVSTTLLQSSDINDQLQAEYDKNNESTAIISGRTAETVLSTRYGLTVVGKEADVYAYLRNIKDIDGAVLVTSYGEELYEDGSEEEKPNDPSLSDKENERNKKLVSKDSTVKAAITIEVYSIYKMPKPITD